MSGTRRQLLLFALAFLFLAPLAHDSVFLAGNDDSRFAQIESLVDYRHSYINESRYSGTVDRVTIGGKDYSNKPPFLSLIGAAIYLLLERLTGLSFARNESATIYLLNLFLAALPSAWLVARFHAALQRTSASALARGLATAALACGTILTSFSGTLNNHTVTAAILFAAFVAALEGRSAWAGSWAALAVCIDIVPGLLFVPVFAVLLPGPRRWLRYAIPLAAGAAAFVAADLFITGSPLPAKLVAGGVDRSSKFGPAVAGVLLPDSWTYPLECLFGWHGFFSVSPVLLFGVLGLALETRKPPRSTWALSAALAVMIGSHAVFVGSYGGWSYGFRYLIPIIPILLFFAPPLIDRHLRLFGAALAVSILFAMIGAYNPWPPGYEQKLDPSIASVVKNPVAGNATAWMQEYFPEARLTRELRERFISPSEVTSGAYLALFYLDKGDYLNADKMVRRLPAEVQSSLRRQAWLRPR